MKLSLAMICKGALEDLKRLQPLVEPYIDEWVVVFPPDDTAIGWAEDNDIKVVIADHTQGIEKETLKEMKDWGLDVDPDYRIFKFAEARNNSFSHATGDYILWLDADDEPVGMENLVDELREAYKADIMNVVYDYARDAQDNPISDHVRERVIKNNGKTEWKGSKLGLIHETVVPKEGEKLIFYDMPKKLFKVVHHSDHVDQSSMRNHTALLYEYLVTKGEDPRTTYYLGTEYFNRKMYENCIVLMQEYIEVGGWDEERYRAWIRMAESYHQLGDRESSKNAYFNAVKELPHYPDAYLGIGESYFSDEQWVKAIEFTLTGMTKKIPDTRSAVDMMRYTFRPLNFLALACVEAGRPGDAWKWFAKAQRMNPKHPWVKKYINLFAELQDLDEYVKAFVKVGQIAKRLYPETLPHLADAVPDTLKDQELLLSFKRSYTTPKMWPDNSIVVFGSNAFEDWGPDSLVTGCGGSEEAIIHLTKRWAKMGYDVTVFNNCTKEEDRDGVKWRRYEHFNPRDAFNILISWRNNAFLDPKIAEKRFIDLHDMPRLSSFPADSLKDVTMMVKSQYHREQFPNLKDDNFAIIPNGLDENQFPKDREKLNNNLVWTSSYDRGLKELLEMWPKIKSEVPTATLDVYYGFGLLDSSPAGKNKGYANWRANMEAMLTQEGVTHHGRVGTEEIAKAYLKADIWAYPTEFPEISCITAMKAQVAGAIPVVTDFAALPETIKEGVIIEGDINDEKVSTKFVEELIGLMKDDKRKEEIRSKLGNHDFSWDTVAAQWDEEFKK
jgi:glycosyltransferase involved in cell wall biosynthesis